MYPILFSIGKVTFYTHGVMAVLGIVVGSLIAYFIASKNKLKSEYFFDNIIFMILAGIIGARIAYFIAYPDQFTTISQIIFIWDGGLVSFGGFILGGGAMALILKTQKQPVLKWMDALSVGFFAGLCIGRWGDILAGEYAGITSSSKWLTLLSNNSIVNVPLLESVLCILIFVAILIVYLKKYDRIGNGMIFLSSGIIYTVGRLGIDFLRSEDKLFLGLSLGQITGLLICVFLIIIMLLLIKNRRNYEQIRQTISG